MLGRDNSRVTRAAPVPVVGSLTGVTGLGAGGRRSCTVSDSGLQCWGAGSLGNGSFTDSWVPVGVTGATGDVRWPVTGFAFGCALVRGAVECWGGGGLLGDGSDAGSPVPVPVTFGP